LSTCFARGLDFEGLDASTRSDHRTFGPSGMHLRDQSGKPSADASVRRAHEFPADIVRAGGRPTKVTYKLQCSRCQRASLYEANGIKSDARVAEKFEQRGWLLGKTRDADVCPTCLGRDPNSQLANGQSSNNPAEMVLSPGQLAELVFMPKKMGEGSPVVEVQGARRMSRARQQAEASLSSVFSGAKPTLTLGGVKPDPRSAAEAVFRAPVPRASVPPAQSSESVDRPFATDRSEADGALRRDMSVLAAALTSMAEQISLMAQVQAAAIVENRDKADLHALLQKQNIELISRIAPVVASAQDLTAGGLREETSQPREIGSTTLAAAPAAITKSPAETTAEAPKVAEPAQGARTTAPATTEAAVEPAPVAKPATPRVLPSLVSPMNQAPAVTETRKAPGKSAEAAKGAKGAKSAGEKARGSKAKVATSVVPDGAAKMPAETTRPTVVSAEGGAPASGKRFRRTKAQMEEFRREQQRLAELGLKRGRGRPSKNSLTAEQLAAIAASEDPEAARAEALAAIREKPVATTSKDASEEAKATAESEAEERDTSAPQLGLPVVNEAPGVETAPAAAPEPVAATEGKRRGPKPKAAAISEMAAAPAPAPEPAAAPVGKRRGRKPKAAAIAETAAPVAVPAVAPTGKRRGPKPKAVAIVEAATPAAEPTAGPERKRGGRKPKAASTPEAVAAPAAAPVQDIAPKRRGPKPKAATPEAASDAVAAPVVKRGRGRPRKDAAVPSLPGAAKASPAADSVSSVDWAKAKVTSDVMVLSSGKTTTIQIGRKVWQAAGFADDEAVLVSSANGRDIKIAKQPGGRKPSSAKSSVITLTVPSIGEASLWKIKYVVEGGSLLLRGKVAN
jgi:hypothetical protein